MCVRERDGGECVCVCEREGDGGGWGGGKKERERVGKREREKERLDVRAYVFVCLHCIDEVLPVQTNNTYIPNIGNIILG